MSVADTDTINFKFAFNIAMWETGSMFLTCDLLANHEKTRGLLIISGKGGKNFLFIPECRASKTRF